MADSQNAPPPHIKIDFLVQPYLVGGSAGSSLVEPGHSVRGPVHLRVGTAAGMEVSNWILDRSAQWLMPKTNSDEREMLYDPVETEQETL